MKPLLMLYAALLVLNVVLCIIHYENERYKLSIFSSFVAGMMLSIIIWNL